MSLANQSYFDVIILGAGAAGLMTARVAASRGLKVLILEHNSEPGKKILISGGGRCNFTNLYAESKHFVSSNEHFCISALKRFTPGDFIKYVDEAGIDYFEKKDGQLFCQNRASDLVNWFVEELKRLNVTLLTDCRVNVIARPEKAEPHKEGPLRGQSSQVFLVETSQGDFQSRALVVATGGLSVPKVGATDLGYKIAKQFGHTIMELEPALDGLTWPNSLSLLSELSGYSLEAKLTLACGQAFTESLLFTHKGLSGPVALNTSLYWHQKEPVTIHFLPKINWTKELEEKKRTHGGLKIATLLNQYFSEKFTTVWMKLHQFPDSILAQTGTPLLKKISDSLSQWNFIPSGTVGYVKAEVTRGGVSTFEIDSKTMESKKVPGLYFVGEVLDVTGQLGGFNFQWAWASGSACGLALRQK